MSQADDTSDSDHDGSSQGSAEFRPSYNNSTMLIERDDTDRADTPETQFTDVPSKPDITIFCDKMKCYVDVRSLWEHRAYLLALEVMKYKGTTKPEDVERLLHRRNNLVKMLRSKDENDSVDPKELRKINDAYELLKANLQETFESHRRVRYNIDTVVRGVSLNCSPTCVQAVGICTSGNERWKNMMEDTRVYQDYFGNDSNKCFLGIYDGHHGKFAAEVAAAELHKLLLHEMSKFDPRTKSTVGVPNLAQEMDISRYNFDRPTTKDSERVILHEESMDIVSRIISLCEDKYEFLMRQKSNLSEKNSEKAEEKKSKKKTESPLSKKMSAAFKKVYQLLDILLSYGKDECSRVRWSGCSALTMVIESYKEREIILENSKEPDNSCEMEKRVVELDTNGKTSNKLGVIHLANAGNVRAMLIRGNKPHTLTKDHTPHNSKERTRILKHGGTVSESEKDARVNGVLATTRGLGNHGDKKLKKCVLVEPYTTCVPIDEHAQLIVMASHGVWEVFNDDQVTSLLVQLLPSNQVPPPDRLSSSLKLFIETLNQVSRCPSAATAEQVSIISNHRGHSATSSTDPDFTPRVGCQDMIRPATGDSRVSDQITEEFARGSKTNAPRKTSSAKLAVPRVTDAGSHGDMKTEMGSHMGDYSDDDESGHEGDVDTYGEATAAELSMLSDNLPSSHEEVQREVAKAMAEYLVQAALLAGARDNITVAVVLLPGSGL